MVIFDKVMEEIQKFRHKEISLIFANFKRELRKFEFLNSFIEQISTENFNDSYSAIIAIDGGSAITNLQGITLSLAIARTFSISTKNLQFSKDEEEDEFEINTSEVSTESNIISSLQLKRLEFAVAKQKLNKIIKHYKNVFLLFDGSFSFPDEDMGKRGQLNTNLINNYEKDDNSNLKNAFINFQRSYSDFFSRVVELNKSEYKIIPISIAKDPISPKYIKGIFNNNKDSLNKNQLNDLNQLIKKKSFSEKSLIEALIKTNKDKFGKGGIFFRITRVEKSSKGELAIKYLKNGLFGFYFALSPWTRPFYREVPKDFEQDFPEIFSLLSYTSRLSPIPGYPFPLVYVDLYARATKDFSSKIFEQLTIEAKKIDPEIADLIIEEQFREKLHKEK